MKQKERPTVAFTLDWVDDDEKDEDGEPVVRRSDTFHATQPTDERLFVVAAMIGDEDNGAGEATAVMDLLRDALPPKEFRTLRERLLNPEDSVDMEVLGEVMEWLMEKWSDFPTQPSSASSGSPSGSGTKSTGRVRGSGSTQ